MAENSEFEPVMPFITVTSKGGPHDDQSYVAGYEMGQLDSRLAVMALYGDVGHTATLRTENLPQAELIAMKHGFTCDLEVYAATSEWALVSFVRPESDGDD
jgi:hypothetical protein